MKVTLDDIRARRDAARAAGDSIARDAYDMLIAHVLGVADGFAGANATLRAIRTGEALEY